MSIYKYSLGRKTTKQAFINSVIDWTNLTRRTVESIYEKFLTKKILVENKNMFIIEIDDKQIKFSFSYTARDGYNKYLKTDHWKKTREKFLKLRNYTCQRCNIRGGILQCHHLNYNNLWNEKDEDILVVCNKCHDKIHNN